MTGIRFFALATVAAALLLTAAPAGRGQTPASPSAGHVNKVYSLADFGVEPEFATWIAATIPSTIMPESWSKSGTGGKEGTLSYYAPGRVLVVYHTPAAHAQIEVFLQNVRKAMPPSAMAMPASVLQAQAGPIVPPAYVPAPPMPAPLAREYGYPVPAAATLPKHLFHFIIRYEGEGIIDSNVVKFAQSLQEKVTGANSCPVPSYTPGVPTPALQPTPYGPMPATLSGMPGAPRMPAADNPGPAPSSTNPPILATPSSLPATNTPPPPPPFGPTTSSR